MTYLISKENQGVELDDKIFDFLIYQDVEDITPRIAIEMAWVISSFIPWDNDFITNFKDSVLFVFSRVNWFTKNKIDFEEYVESLLAFIASQPQSKAFNEKYLITRICHETAIFDMEECEWIGLQADDLPDEINALLPAPVAIGEE